MKILKKIAYAIIIVILFSISLRTPEVLFSPNTPPMLTAVTHNHIQSIKIMIENGANVNEVYPSRSPNTTALMQASRYGRLEIMTILIQNGANVNFQDDLGYTAIMRAARNGQFEAVKILVQNGADVNAYNSGKMSAVRFASSDNQHPSDKHIDMVKYLLEHGAKCSDLRRYPIYQKVCSSTK